MVSQTLYRSSFYLFTYGAISHQLPYEVMMRVFVDYIHFCILHMNEPVRNGNG